MSGGRPSSLTPQHPNTPTPSSPSPNTLHLSPSPIRSARPEEAATLSDLALRSKGHWGYDAEFLERCRDDLTYTPEEVATSTIYVAEGTTGIAGFYCLVPLNPGVALLDDLFVDPAAMGQGVGRRLWEHMVETARGQGYAEVQIQSDPFAEGFYQAMGAVRIGEQESSVTPGRMLPLLRFGLGDG